MPRPVVYPNTFGALSGQVSAALIDQNFNADGAILNDSGAGWSNAAVDTGSTNNYVVTLVPPAAAYTNGFLLSFIPITTNTGPASINVNGLGNIQIVGPDGSALGPNQINIGTLYTMVCINNAFRVISPPTVTTLSFVGEMKMWSGSVAPFNWLLAQGQALSRTLFADLFSVCGTTYGPGDGSTTFNIPDMRGRSPMGAGQGAGLSNRALGSKLGEEVHVLSVTELASHSHVVSDPTHNHGHSDPTHSHFINDAGHAHALSDPGHNHAVFDPTHSHLYFSPQSTTGAAGGAVFASNGASTLTTSASATGISIASRVTGMSVIGAYTGIFNSFSATGIANLASATGISLLNQGSNFPHNTVHPVQVVNYIIRAF